MLIRVAADGSIANDVAAIIDFQTIFDGAMTHKTSNNIIFKGLFFRKSALRFVAIFVHLR